MSTEVQQEEKLSTSQILLRETAERAFALKVITQKQRDNLMELGDCPVLDMDYTDYNKIYLSGCDCNPTEHGELLSFSVSINPNPHCEDDLGHFGFYEIDHRKLRDLATKLINEMFGFKDREQMEKILGLTWYVKSSKKEWRDGTRVFIFVKKL